VIARPSRHRRHNDVNHAVPWEGGMTTAVKGYGLAWALFLTAAALIGSPTQPAAQQAMPAAGTSGEDTPVQLSRHATPVQVLFKTLAWQAHCRLAATEAVRWDRVTISVRRRPLTRVRADLAELLYGTWKRSDDGTRTLNQDTNALAYEAKRRR